jgi:hypothetical protein
VYNASRDHLGLKAAFGDQISDKNTHEIGLTTVELIDRWSSPSGMYQSRQIGCFHQNPLTRYPINHQIQMCRVELAESHY